MCDAISPSAIASDDMRSLSSCAADCQSTHVPESMINATNAPPQQLGSLWDDRVAFVCGEFVFKGVFSGLGRQKSKQAA